MKRALDEGAAYGRLPSLAGVGRALSGDYPDSSLTAFTLRSKDSFESTGSSHNMTFTPRLTLHQFRQFQISPVLSSSPDLDYKRVRRKKPFTQLNVTSLESANALAQTTSSWPLGSTTSSQSFLPSFQPTPILSTPVPRQTPRAPSLSSTVDTLQSTPLRTPIQQGGSDLEQWREFERSKLVEPLRTKRKFPLFKQPKRLPHGGPRGASSSGSNGGTDEYLDGEIWEVHAVVVDPGGFVSAGSSGGFERGAANVTQSRSGGKKARSVRFKGIDENISREQSRGLGSLRSEEEKESSLSSSFSLSKFTFPEPPGNRLPGAFEQHGEPTPPTSPAILHYKGASFDLVNPHESLILGSSEIETPAEIDGLLDDYFARRSTFDEMQPYDNFTGEMSASQTSLPTNASSNGRQRVLYDNPDNARRNIMGIGDDSRPRVTSQGPYQESPLANRGHGRWLEGSAIWPQSHPGMMWYGLDGQNEREDAPNPLQIQRNVTEAIRRGAATRPDDRGDGFENVDLAGEPGPFVVGEDSDENQPPAAQTDEDIFDFSNEDRDSALYPQSQASDPFDLDNSVGDSRDNDQRFNNIDEVLGRDRFPSHGEEGAQANVYDPAFDPIHEDEDVAEAQAFSNPNEAETTLGDIVSHYDYARPPLQPRYLFGDEYYDDDDEYIEEPSSELIEDQRGNIARYDVFQGQSSSSPYSFPPVPANDSGHVSRLHNRGEILNPLRHATSRRMLDGPPRMMAPTPPQSVIEARASGQPYYPHSSGIPTTDQTYGSTEPLLNLTPQQQYHTPWRSAPRADPAGDDYRAHFVPPGYGGQQDVRAEDVEMEEPHAEGEDKENAPPPQAAADVQMGLTVPQGGMRSSSIYPDDEADWQTERSESHPYFEDPAAAARPSEESYANTSRYTLDNHRLSFPPQAPAHPIRSGPPQNLSTFGFTSRTYGRPPPDFGQQGTFQSTISGPGGPVDGSGKGKQPAQSGSRTGTFEASANETADKTKTTTPMKKMVSLVGDKVARLKITSPKARYTPNTKPVLPLGFIREAHQSASSDRQGLLQHQGAPGAGRGLSWSDTAGTFATSPSLPAQAPSLYTPLAPGVTPPSRSLLRDSRTAAGFAAQRYNPPGTPTAESFEMSRLRRQGTRRVSRAAMSSQTELQPLAMADSITGPLTDAELAQDERNWTREPQRNALARILHHPDAFVIRQDDGTYERISSMMHPHDARNIGLYREQKDRTAPYFTACVLCPITSLIFGLGGFDWRMRQITKGKITEMLPSKKKSALYVWTTLSFIAWLFFGLVITILTVAIG